MKKIVSKQNRPALLALVVGAFVGISPLFIALTPETTFIALLLGMLTAMIAVKRLLRPGSYDPLGFIALGALIAIAPFIPLAGVEWIKFAAGALVVMAGIWYYVSGTPNPPPSEEANREGAAPQP